MKLTFRSKLVLLISLCSFFCTLLVGAIGYFQTYKVLTEKSKTELQLITKNETSNFNSMFSNIEQAVRFVKNTTLSDFDLDKAREDPSYLKSYSDKIAPATKRLAETTQGAMGLYISLNPDLFGVKQGIWYADTNNKNVFLRQEMTDIKQFSENDIEHVGWYYGPIKAGKGLWLDPYLNKNINVTMISYVEPIYIDNTPIGVVGMDVNFNLFKEALEKVKVYDTGYAALISSEGDFLIHPTFTSKDNINTINNGSIKFVMDELNKSEAGVIEYKFEDLDIVQGHARLSNGYIIGVVVPKDELLKDLNRYTTLILIVDLIMFTFIFIIGFYFSSSVSRKVKYVTEILQKASNYDLSQDKDLENKRAKIKTKDEIGIMALASLKMREEFKNLITLIKKSSKNVTLSSENLSNITKETVHSIDAVAKSTDDLANGATELAKNVQDGVTKLENLSDEITEISNGTELMNKYIEETRNANKEGLMCVNALEIAVKDNIDMVQKVGVQFKNLDSNSKLIGKMTETIKSIASQINLLSLNASIEAARAGEHGRGFAVVAEEIRKLAYETSNSTKEIENIVKKIQDDINITKSYVEDTKNVIEKTDESNKKTQIAFNLIGSSVKNILTQINLLIDSIKKVDREKGGVIIAIESVSAVSEESAAATEQISASVQEQTSSIEQISQSTNTLRDIASELDSLINKFTI